MHLIDILICTLISILQWHYNYIQCLFLFYRTGKLGDLKAPCNSACRCSTFYSPVCGRDNIGYFSPCFAGCTYSKTIDIHKVIIFNYASSFPVRCWSCRWCLHYGSDPNNLKLNTLSVSVLWYLHGSGLILKSPYLLIWGPLSSEFLISLGFLPTSRRISLFFVMWAVYHSAIFLTPG